MASESKTEKATPKRRKDERKKGNIFQSKDVVNAASILLIFFTLRITFPYLYENFANFLYHIVHQISYVETLTVPVVITVLQDAFVLLLISAGPVMLISMAIGIIATGGQTKFLFAYENIKVKFNRLSPLKGVKRLFSLRSVVELIKSMAKVVIIAYVLYAGISDVIGQAKQLMYVDIFEAVGFILNAILVIAMKVAVIFLGLAIFDYLYQKWEYEKNIKMTKHEIKEEYKHTEGDPLIKGKIKDTQRKISMSRMIQQVLSADVVVRNPTHYAIALKYNAEKSSAPVVVAKGQDHVALRIVAEAEKYAVPITENPLLTRALYENVELNREIPPEYYSALAEILAWVYSLKQEK
ncbi:MAG TPA: flagellar biosynthesis protein FlhB [Clostridiales bacterium]|nr:flagellar biosynthesis protein FlhB [Clostridiales bacterium]